MASAYEYNALLTYHISMDVIKQLNLLNCSANLSWVNLSLTLQIIAQNFHSVYPISAIPGNALEYEVASVLILHSIT